MSAITRSQCRPNAAARLPRRKQRLALTRRSFLQGATCLALSRALRPVYAADDPEQSASELITQPAQRAIDRGLEFLAERQNDEGAFASSPMGRNVAICGLAGMAFLSSGSTPGRGRYGKRVQLCLDYLLAHAQESGFIVVPEAASHGPMYGHGFATLFLAECYGMDMRAELREKLAKAIKLIVNTQNREGGWRYQPQKSEADISVTVAQVVALRAARNAGIQVPKATIDRAMDYVKRCQNPDGGFMYMLSVGGPSQFPRSAAGLVALYGAGIYQGPEIDKALQYLMRFLPPSGDPDQENHYFYGQYYAAQAMWQAGSTYWRKWYPAIREVLIERQNRNGSWIDRLCSEYGTSMACLVLQMPNNYLPIFQR